MILVRSSNSRLLPILLVTLVLVLLTTGTAGAQLLPNTLVFKLGYHSFVQYDEASGSDHNGTLDDGEFDRSIHIQRMNGFSFQVEYARWFHEMFSVSLSTGIYGGIAPFAANVEGSSVSGHWDVLVWPVHLTPRLHLPFKSVDLYTGAGLGIYFLSTDFFLEVDNGSDRRTVHQSDFQSKLGWHALVGIEWRFHMNWGVVLEDRFAFARFHGDNENTDVDEFDAGGNNLYLGVRWHF